MQLRPLCSDAVSPRPMNGASPEMLHCAGLTVLERQRARIKWHQHHHHRNLSHEPEIPLGEVVLPAVHGLHSVPTEAPEMSVMQELATSQGLSSLNGWPDFAKYPACSPPAPAPAADFVPTGFGGSTSEGLGYSISGTSSCSPTAREKSGSSPAPGKTAGKESSEKRKADKFVSLKESDVVADSREKSVKGDSNESESKATEQNLTSTTTTATTTNNTNNNGGSINTRESSEDTSKEHPKVTEVQKPDYIHVRARRGQATDSHSLAERVRREKISERMKYLQDLVPGCNKITGKAGMLDEIINYVQSLQRQVEFLSMKLATVNPRLDFNIDNLFAKEMLPGSSAGFSAMGVLPELTDPGYLQFNATQVGTSCGLDMQINSSEISLQRTTSAPVTLPNSFVDSYFHADGSTSTAWDIDLSTLYNFQQGRQSVFPSPFSGNLELNNLKMEM